MNTAEILAQLRRFLLLLSVVLFAGSLIELWLVGHTEDTIQWLAFGLAIAGGVSAFAQLFRPSVRILRVVMIGVILGSVVGVVMHIIGNVEFEREIQANAPTTTVLWKALQGGNPLLAPGILAVAAILALMATYRYRVQPQE